MNNAKIVSKDKSVIIFEITPPLKLPQKSTNENILPTEGIQVYKNIEISRLLFCKDGSVFYPISDTMKIEIPYYVAHLPRTNNRKELLENTLNIKFPKDLWRPFKVGDVVKFDSKEKFKSFISDTTYMSRISSVFNEIDNLKTTTPIAQIFDIGMTSIEINTLLQTLGIISVNIMTLADHTTTIANKPLLPLKKTGHMKDDIFGNPEPVMSSGTIYLQWEGWLTANTEGEPS